MMVAKSLTHITESMPHLGQRALQRVMLRFHQSTPLSDKFGKIAAAVAFIN
jgi:hypothetical protein